MNDTMTCPTCMGDACEEACGECHDTPSTAGPNAHRQCVRCKGAGVVKVDPDT